MDFAASLPALIASTAVAGPVTLSPPAKILSTLVAKVTGSTSKVFRFPREILLFFGTNDRSHVCPIAGTTASTSNVNSDPSIATGRLRPLSSASPSFILTHFTPDTFPLAANISTGATKNSILIPSARASSISSEAAGISSRVLR